MNFFVCVKSVPDTDTINFDQETGTLKRNDAKAVLNPCDLVGVEAALLCAERYSATTQAVSMGPESATTGLRTALAMGVNSAHLLKSAVFGGADVPATAYALSAFFENIGEYNIIFCGKHSADGDTGQVGPWLAQLLDIPHLGAVCEISKIQGGHVFATQRIDNMVLESIIPTPCLLVIENDMHYPRMASLKNTLRAKKQTISLWTEENIKGLDISRCGLKGSATRVKKVYVPKRSRSGVMIDQSEVSLLLPILLERGAKQCTVE